jgi:hypothetical protein
MDACPALDWRRECRLIGVRILRQEKSMKSRRKSPTNRQRIANESPTKRRRSDEEAPRNRRRIANEATTKRGS